MYSVWRADPFASHDPIRELLAVSPAQNLMLEGEKLATPTFTEI